MLPKEYSLLWPLVRVSETYFLPPPVSPKGGFADIAWRMVPLQACPKATACREAFFPMRVGRLTHTWDWLLVTHLTPALLAERWRDLRRELNQSPNAVGRRPPRDSRVLLAALPGLRGKARRHCWPSWGEQASQSLDQPGSHSTDAAFQTTEGLVMGSFPRSVFLDYCQ